MATSLKESVSLYFLRDGSCLRFTMDELTVNDEDDWFLPLLIKNTNTLNTTRFVEILEDRNSVLSIIESIRYMKLILFKDVELEYLLALATKWCVPIWLIEEIDEKIKEKEIFNSDYEKRFKTFLDNQIMKCNNCKMGFYLKENTAESCKFHTDEYCRYGAIMKCCGASSYHESYCKVGLHVISPNEILAYKKIFEGMK